jgi:hypothetical protein
MCSGWAGFVNNFAAGIVSGLVILLSLWLYRAWNERRTYSPMSGEYDECEMPAGIPTSGTVKIKSQGSKLLTQGVRENGQVLWTGVIHMSPYSPNVGDGVYQYCGTNDCGCHHIQRQTESGDFVVLGSNTSHPEGKERFNMLWRRKRN